MDKIVCGYVYKGDEILCTEGFVDMLILWVSLWISVLFGYFSGANEGKKRERGLVGEMGGVAC